MSNDDHISDKQPNQLALFDLMPHNNPEQAILHNRAQLLAQTYHKTSVTTQDTDHYVHFLLGQQESYGIPYAHVQEIIINVNPTPVPHAPSYISGVINYHGSLLSVINLKRLLGIDIEPQESNGPLIILFIQNIHIALSIDTILESECFDPNKLDTGLIQSGSGISKYIMGLHHGITAIINPDALIAEIQYQANRFNKEKV